MVRDCLFFEAKEAAPMQSECPNCNLGEFWICVRSGEYGGETRNL